MGKKKQLNKLFKKTNSKQKVFTTQNKKNATNVAKLSRLAALNSNIGAGRGSPRGTNRNNSGLSALGGNATSIPSKPRGRGRGRGKSRGMGRGQSAAQRGHSHPRGRGRGRGGAANVAVTRTIVNNNVARKEETAEEKAARLRQKLLAGTAKNSKDTWVWGAPDSTPKKKAKSNHSKTNQISPEARRREQLRQLAQQSMTQKQQSSSPAKAKPKKQTAPPPLSPNSENQRRVQSLLQHKQRQNQVKQQQQKKNGGKKKKMDKRERLRLKLLQQQQIQQHQQAQQRQQQQKQQQLQKQHQLQQQQKQQLSRRQKAQRLKRPAPPLNPPSQQTQPQQSKATSPPKKKIRLNPNAVVFQMPNATITTNPSSSNIPPAIISVARQSPQRIAPALNVPHGPVPLSNANLSQMASKSPPQTTTTPLIPPQNQIPPQNVKSYRREAVNPNNVSFTTTLFDRKHNPKTVISTHPPLPMPMPSTTTDQTIPTHPPPSATCSSTTSSVQSAATLSIPCSTSKPILVNLPLDAPNWQCQICTFHNENNPSAVCSMCQQKNALKMPIPAQSGNNNNALNAVSNRKPSPILSPSTKPPKPSLASKPIIRQSPSTSPSKPIMKSKASNRRPPAPCTLASKTQSKTSTALAISVNPSAINSSSQLRQSSESTLTGKAMEHINTIKTPADGKTAVKKRFKFASSARPSRKPPSVLSPNVPQSTVRNQQTPPAPSSNAVNVTTSTEHSVQTKPAVTVSKSVAKKVSAAPKPSSKPIVKSKSMVKPQAKPQPKPKVNRMIAVSLVDVWKMDLKQTLNDEELELFIKKTDCFIESANKELLSECRQSGVRYTDPVSMVYSQGSDLDISLEFEWIKKVSQERKVSWKDNLNIDEFSRAITDVAY